MYNNDDSSGRVKKGGRHRLVIKVDGLSGDERAYLLGLFLADGSLVRVKLSAMVHFSLAENEMELAERVSVLLGRLGLHPSIKVYSGDKNYIDVGANGVALLSYFPDKKRLVSLDGGALEQWFDREGLYGELDVPFIAGLMDGDGYADASCSRAGIFPRVEVSWSFAQKKLGFLVDYIVRYMGGLTSHGVSVYTRKSGKGRIVRFTASGREALLGMGVARWSLKVSHCEAKAEGMKKEVADLKSRFYTTLQVAHKLHVSRATVLWWCNHRWVGFMQVRSNRYGAGNRYRFLVPVEEVERLEAKLAEGEKGKEGLSVFGKLLSAKEASRVLGIARESVSRLCKDGKLKFASIRTVGGKKKFLIPVEEVERNKRERHTHGHR